MIFWGVWLYRRDIEKFLDVQLVAARFGKRAAEVKLVIPFSLLKSQLELLRNDEFEW